MNGFRRIVAGPSQGYTQDGFHPRDSLKGSPMTPVPFPKPEAVITWPGFPLFRVSRGVAHAVHRLIDSSCQWVPADKLLEVARREDQFDWPDAGVLFTSAACRKIIPGEDGTFKDAREVMASLLDEGLVRRYPTREFFRIASPRPHGENSAQAKREWLEHVSLRHTTAEGHTVPDH